MLITPATALTTTILEGSKWLNNEYARFRIAASPRSRGAIARLITTAFGVMVPQQGGEHRFLSTQFRAAVVKTMHAACVPLMPVAKDDMEIRVAVACCAMICLRCAASRAVKRKIEARAIANRITMRCGDMVIHS